MRWQRALDLTFVMVCVLALGILAWRAVRPTATTGPQGFEVNERIGESIPSDYSSRERTVLVIVHPTCVFCTQSMAFYRTLRDSAGRCSQIGLLFVSTASIEATRIYTETHGVGGVTAVSVPLRILKGSRYPTILSLDNSGMVIRKWQGVLSPEDQQDVLASATCAPGSH